MRVALPEAEEVSHFLLASVVGNVLDLRIDKLALIAHVGGLVMIWYAHVRLWKT